MASERLRDAGRDPLTWVRLPLRLPLSAAGCSCSSWLSSRTAQAFARLLAQQLRGDVRALEGLPASHAWGGALLTKARCVGVVVAVAARAERGAWRGAVVLQRADGG